MHFPDRVKWSLHGVHPLGNRNEDRAFIFLYHKIDRIYGCLNLNHRKIPPGLAVTAGPILDKK